MIGVLAAIQTFGNRTKFYPHLHFLVTEGGMDEAGVYYEIPRIDDSRLEDIFAREVLAMLVRQELLARNGLSASSPGDIQIFLCFFY